MIRIETERLILRPFSDGDLSALFMLLSDEEVTVFLLMFPLKDMEDARSYLRYIETWIRNGGLYYAICLKDSDLAVGCIHVSGDDSHDLGYCIRKEFWHNGFCTESCRAVVDLLRRMGLPYITATHDVNNPRSGRVMQTIGMRYCYSYEELWQPKNFPVIFRMYQLNLDGQMTGCIVSIGIAIRCISPTPPLLSFGGLFHVEYERGEPRRFASLVLFFVIDRRYLPNFTSKTFTSAGETPGIREAWPIVVGRMRVSFCRASIVSDCIE